MVGKLQPLVNNQMIVGPDGKPTEYFIRWAQQRQIDIGDAIDEAKALEIIQTFIDSYQLQEGSGIGIVPDGKLTSNPTISAKAQEILNQISTVRGTVLFRGDTDWQGLAPGTSGQFLKTNGAGADPAWAAAGGTIRVEDEGTLIVASATALNFAGSGVTVTDAGGGEALVTIPGGGGGGSVGPWTLVASWIWSSNVTFVDLTGFGSYTDLYIVSEGLAVASSSARFILFSVDGGATFFTTNQYINISNIGQRISENQAVATAASAAVRDVLLIALGAGKVSTRKPIQAMTGDRFFIGSDQPINAIRLLTSPVVNLTGGSIFVYAR